MADAEYSPKVLKYLASMGMKPDKYAKIRFLVDTIVNSDPKPSKEDLITKFGMECYGTFKPKDATKQAKKFLKTVYGSVDNLIEQGSQKALEQQAAKDDSKMRVVRLQNPIDGFQEKIGDYLLGEQIGEGATSKVFLGRVVKTKDGKKKECALKILKVGEKFSVQNLQKEIKVLKALKHKNINGMMDCFENVIYPDVVKKGTTTVMVLELATRGELYDYIHATGAFEPDLARWCFKGMMDGLNYCHSKGVVHRDLKPENVLLDGDYVVKLVDFGFARFYDEKKELMTTRLGTPGYVAPEILRAKKYTPIVDIFTMGVILFSIYSGFPPFREQKKTDWWWDKLSKKNYGLFWKAHEQAKKYEDEFKDLVSRMLAFDPKERITNDKILAHKWLTLSMCSQEEAVKRLEKRKIEVDRKAREKATKIDTTVKRALEDHDPPVHHGWTPLHTFNTIYVAKQVEEIIAARVKDVLMGKTEQVKCGLYVGEMVDEIDRNGNVLKEEEKDGTQGLEWTDLKFTVQSVAEKKDPDADGELYEGIVSVRQHPTMTWEDVVDGKKVQVPMNIFFFKRANTASKNLKKEDWFKILEEILKEEVAALIWAPPVEKKEVKESVEDKYGIVNDLDEAAGGGCMPCAPPAAKAAG